MKKINRLLGPSIGRDEVMRAAAAQRALRQWEEVVGPYLAERSCPDRYDHGTVWVAVKGSAWAQELRMIKDKILHKLSEMTGDPTLFENVRFGVRPPTDRSLYPEPLPEPELPRPDKSGLSIREMAEERLRNWKPS